MITLIESKMERLPALCEKYGVIRLDVFGSAVTDEWDPKTSDLDFLVTFGPPPVGMDGFDQYMDFLLDRQRMYLRKVDLVEKSAMKNPYFIAAVNKQRVPIYAKVAA